jgi:hypothetical protein
MKETMNDETLNSSVRKFLKTVGVNSQLAIEKAVRQSIASGELSDNASFPAHMTLTIERIGVSIKFVGELRLE